ncbi:MAG: endonuclease Q family protein [Bacillota bacterium]
MFKNFYADLHIHIGGGSDGSPVKITASRKLNFPNILKEGYYRKGLDIVGIIDCASPVVIDDIEKMLSKGEMVELASGGILYRDELLVLLGAEIESREKNGGQVHYLSFFPYLADIREFSRTMEQYISNINLSSQTAYITGPELLKIVEYHGGILIPAHIFTPHKSFYGRAFSSYREGFTDDEWEKISAVELGLSADTEMADLLSELEDKSFLTNSDAHSLPKIAREYNIIQLKELNFKEIEKAFKQKKGRKIAQNFGLDPALGKYHRSYCEKCDEVFSGTDAVLKCPLCGNKNIIVGVKDRILDISQRKNSKSPSHRPEYRYQIPLLDIPGIGEKTLDRMLRNCGTEMDILHRNSEKELDKCLNSRLLDKILTARRGEFKIDSGGGGIYGKVII